VTCVLVTGASGFVGRAVCERALALGVKVKGAHRSSCTQSLVPQGVEKIQIASVSNNTDWSDALIGVDVVIHLAGRVHIAKDTVKDPLATYREVNTAGTSWLARMAASAGVRRLVYVSTIKVHGEQTVTAPFTETDAPQPQDAYAISKWESEQALHRIEVESGLEIVILRPPLVYGEGVGANFLRLLNLVSRGIPLPLASVQNRRSLIYVKNLADAVLTSATHPRAKGRTFLVSDGDDISTPELVRRIAETMELPPRMFRVSTRLLGVVARILGKSGEADRLLSSLIIDSTKIRFEIGWMPRYTMLQGLRETIRWYLANEPSAPEVSGPPDRLVPRLDPSAKRQTR
jgi:UDP-N-acetyl-alpha-D-quinovosamine dehydrogenase